MIRSAGEDFDSILMRMSGAGTTLPEYAVEPLPASGSTRRYYRIRILSDNLCSDFPKSAIACVSGNKEENNTFLKLTKYLYDSGLNVPHIYAVSEDLCSYLLQDLGNKDLLSVIKSADKSQKWDFVEESVAGLVKFQRLPEEDWKDLVQFPPLATDLIRYDINYALDNLIIPTGVEYDAGKLDGEFQLLEKRLLSFPRELWGLMYRDFQSRNVMIADRAYFIDYQSARKGPGVYDLVSFAWQAKAGFTGEERKRIIEMYCDGMELYIPDSGDVIREEVDYWALFRIIQTLGAYGLRGIRERKRHFLESLPPALSNVLSLLSSPTLSGCFPALQSTLSNVNKKLKK